ncbi:MAG: hypothetical protein ACT452_13345 [Microthrixaceae bacterium]
MLPVLRPDLGVPAGGSPLRTSGSDAADLDYIGTYVVLAEYADIPADAAPDDVLHELADLLAREALLTGLAQVNASLHRQDLLESLTAFYREVLAPEYVDRFDAAMRVPSGGLGRMLVAPQPILTAMRWLLGRPPRRAPVEEFTGPATIAQAVLFSHAIGSLFHNELGDRDDLTADEQKRLMVVMMNLGSLGETPDLYSSLDRVARLWRDHGDMATPRLGRSAESLLLDATGLELGDILALSFALLAHVMAWTPDVPFALTDAIVDTVEPAIVEIYRDLMSQRLDDSASVGDPLNEFDLLAIESRPVLSTHAGLVVLDEHLLWRRCTSGLYWIVHDWLKQTEGERARGQWSICYGEMIEALVEESLRSVAPPVLTGRSYFTEDDFESAYGAIARCDVGIDFGASLLLVEIVSGQLTVPSRVHADLDQLDKDFDKLVVEKCRQLDSTATQILNDEAPLTGVPRGVRFPVVVPAVVVGGEFPLNSLSYRYLRTRLRSEGLLDHPRIEPLAILDLEDVEALEGLAALGHDPTTVLAEWQHSELQDVPLNNFLLRQGIGGRTSRPDRMKQRVDELFEELSTRLGFRGANERSPSGTG